MKKKLHILLIVVIMIIASVACQKKNDVKSNSDLSTEVLEQSQAVDSGQISPTITPTTDMVAITPTTAPTAALTSTITPSVTPVEETMIEENTEVNNYINPIIMDTPPFSYYISENVAKSSTSSIKLKKRLSEPNDIIDDDAWFTDYDLDRLTFQVPNSYQFEDGNLPSDIDTTWKDLIITSAFFDDTHIYCTYGSDFSQGYILKIYDAESLEVKYVIDFSNYRYSPKYVESDYDFIEQKVDWASIKDNILYVSHSHSTYAKSSNYMNAYITAIDLSNMSVLWRSDALISNAYNFLFIGDVILCGYGFTAEDDFLFELDRNTGKVLEKIPLVTAASYLRLKDNALYVRTYNTNYIFDIVP